uniref:Alpha-glucan water dikinase phosphohistidine-like domain-containing protein n=1 Tax=Salix viminalis TaxID=40686 RepID=A0A6N2MUQ2_SALVM
MVDWLYDFWFVLADGVSLFLPIAEMVFGFVYGRQDWYHICESYMPIYGSWVLQAKNKVYRKLAVIVEMRKTGEEENPGVVAVLTPDMPDVCFATCFEQNIVQNLKLKEGKAVSITMKSMNLIISDASGSDVQLISSISSSRLQQSPLQERVFVGNMLFQLSLSLR